MPKKIKYGCIRCGYETNSKAHMYKHLFLKLSPCPQTLNIIELTDEIKQHIIDNRIYIIPEKITPKIIEEPQLFIVIHGGEMDGLKIRQTTEIPPRISVYDLIDVITGTSNQSKKLYERIKEKQIENSDKIFIEVKTDEESLNLYKFPGKNNKNTPVVDVYGVINIINLLSEIKNYSLLLKNANLIINHLGGDINLIKHDIKMNIKDSNISNTTLELHENIQDIGIPAELRSPNCIYCIMVGFNKDINKYVFKFGLCEDFNNRLKNHKKMYPHARVIFAVSFGEYSVKPMEDTIKYFEKVKDRIVYVSTKNSVGREYFACTIEDKDEVIDNILDEIKNKHGNKIKNIYYKDKIDTSFINNIEIEKEKTKQMEAEATIKKIEAEANIKKIEAEENIKKMDLEIMKLKLQYNL
jgi:hypothetical protein